MNISKKIKELKSYKAQINPKYRAYADEVISLFSDRKIEKTKEAEKLLLQLGSRGKAPASAIKMLKEKYSKAEPATGKLSRNTIQTFFVSGKIQGVDIYRQQLKRTGTIKERTYEIQAETYATPIKAKNRAEAEKIFLDKAEEHYTTQRSGEDSNVNKTRKFQGADRRQT